jgi:hypothetical protein
MTALRPLLHALCAAVLGAACASAGAGDSDATTATAKRPAMTASKFTPQQLAPFLPESIGAWKRASLEQPLHRPGSTPGPLLKAQYRNEQGPATVSITGGKPGAAGKSARVVNEQAPATSSSPSTVTVILGNGLIVVASSRAVDAAALRKLVEGLDLAALESAAPAG